LPPWPLPWGTSAEARKYGEQALHLAREIGEPCAESFAFYTLGGLYRDVGDHAASRQCYEQPLSLWDRIGSPGATKELLAGIAWAELGLGEMGQAQAHVAEILAYLDAGGFLDIDGRPLMIYLTCYRVLVAAGDPRASEILTSAHTELQEQAARIPDDALRRCFLENVPENREILREWEAAQARKQS